MQTRNRFISACQARRSPTSEVNRFVETPLPRPKSLAITFCGIFELIIKESGDEGSESLFSSFPSHNSPLELCARSHHPPLALLACSSLSLGKPVEETGNSRFLPITITVSIRRGVQWL